MLSINFPLVMLQEIPQSLQSLTDLRQILEDIQNPMYCTTVLYEDKQFSVSGTTWPDTVWWDSLTARVTRRDMPIIRGQFFTFSPLVASAATRCGCGRVDGLPAHATLP